MALHGLVGEEVRHFACTYIVTLEISRFRFTQGLSFMSVEELGDWGVGFALQVAPKTMLVGSDCQMGRCTAASLSADGGSGCMGNHALLDQYHLDASDVGVVSRSPILPHACSDLVACTNLKDFPRHPSANTRPLPSMPTVLYTSVTD